MKLKIDLNHLKQLAAAADPGPYNIIEADIRGVPPSIQSSNGHLVASIYGSYNQPEVCRLNTAYLAAVSPDVILRLIEMLEEKGN